MAYLNHFEILYVIKYKIFTLYLHPIRFSILFARLNTLRAILRKDFFAFLVPATMAALDLAALTPWHVTFPFLLQIGYFRRLGSRKQDAFRRLRYDPGLHFFLLRRGDFLLRLLLLDFLLRLLRRGDFLLRLLRRGDFLLRLLRRGDFLLRLLRRGDFLLRLLRRGDLLLRPPSNLNVGDVKFVI